MHWVYIHCVCACSVDGWPNEENAPQSRASRVLARIVSARTRTQEHTRVPIYIPRLCIDTYIYSYMTCALAISRRTYPRAHVMATAASTARAIARTCAFEAVQPHARPYPSLTQVHICLNIYVYCLHIHTYIHIHTYSHISRHCYAQLYLHTLTPAHARAHTSARSHASAHRRHHSAQRPAPHRRPAERVPRRWRAAGPKSRRIHRPTW